ncbi:MAG: RnfABCDGE type electron transport complex subunit B [Eggerthellaceae bacterium]|nr:RnfABCDGE type electron transport complex subunit B [Eggerthellaceae bacterium]
MSDLLIPIILLVGTGVIAGIILTIASKMMYVPVDETVAKIQEALPGANCGGCGYPGCDGYAQALGTEEGVSAAQCPVGGQDLVNRLSEILGRESLEMEEMVATVLCKGNHTATRPIMERDNITSCKDARMFFDGGWACGHGCLGLGDCVASCEFNAIKVINGVAVVDRDNCTGCTSCVKVCPPQIITMMPKKQKIYVACSSTDKAPVAKKACDNACIACSKCVKECPYDAIHIENNVAVIDYEKCTNCGKCEVVCPTSVIISLKKPRKKRESEKKPSVSTSVASQNSIQPVQSSGITLDEKTEAKLAKIAQTNPEKAAAMRAVFEKKAREVADSDKSASVAVEKSSAEPIQLDEKTEAKLAKIAEVDPEKAKTMRQAFEAKAHEVAQAKKETTSEVASSASAAVKLDEKTEVKLAKIAEVDPEKAAAMRAVFEKKAQMNATPATSASDAVKDASAEPVQLDEKTEAKLAKIAEVDPERAKTMRAAFEAKLREQK